jgi:5S rRNA maturation endonuclease (ribonuclease M5)
MVDEEVFEELLKCVDNSKDKLVIVEGINDKKSLEKLGFTNIFYINRLPLYKVIDFLMDKKEVVILVDLDKEGRKIYSQLKEQFLNNGVKVNDELRELLFKTELRQIEGLARYIERKEAQKTSLNK